MTMEHDFDPELARRLEARLATYAPASRISPPLARRSARRRVIVAALAAALAASALSLGYEINASAESQGLGCLHPIAKIQLFANGIADSVQAGDHRGVEGHDRQRHDERDSHLACHP